MVLELKLSIYTFNDLTYSVAIIQFDGDEGARLFKKLHALSNNDLIDSIKGSWGSDIKSLSMAKGTLVYEGRPLDMFYLRVELHDGSMYIFEIYRDSMMVISNTDLLDLKDRIISMVKGLIGRIKLPKGKMLCI